MTERAMQPLYMFDFQQKLHYFYDDIRAGAGHQAATFCAEFCHFCKNKD